MTNIAIMAAARRRRGVVTEGFASRVAARLAGVTYRQLDHWTRSGLVAPSLSPARPGTGYRRWYSFVDLVALRTIGELRRGGVSLQAVRHVVDELRRIDDAGMLARVRLVLVGGDVIVAIDDEAALSLLRAPGQGVLRSVVDVGDVVRDLTRLVERRSRPPSRAGLDHPDPRRDPEGTFG